MSRTTKKKKNILQRDVNPKHLLLITAIFGSIFTYVFLLMYPKYIDIKDSYNKISIVEDEIREYKINMGSIDSKNMELKAITEEEKVKSSIVNHKMQDGMFWIGLSQLMEKVDVKLLEYTLSDSISYDTFFAIPTKLSVRGDYKSVRTIMNYLENQENMTQILDYRMETYIKPQEQSSTTTTFTKQAVNSASVFWIEDDSNIYHSTQFCPSLSNNTQPLINGSVSDANKAEKTVAHSECCATGSELATEVETEESKAEGDIEATFEFIIYSLENPTIELENGDASEWKPGKNNPFTTTID